jgi:magnesium transporter
MDIIVYRPGAERVEEGFTVAQLPELLRDEALTIWIDFQAPTLADDDVLLNVFKFHPLTVEDCRANRHHPKVEEFPDYLYYIVHAVRTDASPERFNTIELDGFLLRHAVVTYHHEPLNSIDVVKQRVRASPIPCQRGAAFMLHQIIDQIVDDYQPVMDDFDERISQLEDDIFETRRPNDKILEEVLGLKRSVLRLRRISAKQLDVLYRMSHGQFQLIGGPVLPFYRDIYDHLVRVTDLAENYRDLIGGALDAYLSVVSNRLNEIMKVLTIFSAIMLPLTFITGFFGMNLPEITGIHSHTVYAGLWLGMIAIIVLMLYLFYRRGWIGRTKSKDEG